ncbi:MAG: hypothetical protein LBQ15_11535 [Clostridium sp.]|nr:hypothetical protein [Clostridium sp.]
MTKINQYQETNPKKQAEMDKKLDSLKLERIKSLWYFVVGSSKSVIVGGKS